MATLIISMQAKIYYVETSELMNCHGAQQL